MPKVRIPPMTAASGYDAVAGVDLGPYAEASLGDAAGLTQFGMRIETLPPGSRSSLRHWHEHEDELVYVLAGELVLIEDTETSLRAGEAAAWKAGSAVGHCLANRGVADATYLVIGTRALCDTVHYPDDNLVFIKDGPSRSFTRGDGTPLPEGEA